mmetsp:Transcript_32340/g.105950  ORF Transcript_32340/g.105950 Transcript_32340/m.105950 type:complete len:117 (+) Transcript_32340:476-826(+)
MRPQVRQLLLLIIIFLNTMDGQQAKLRTRVWKEKQEWLCQRAIHQIKTKESTVKPRHEQKRGVCQGTFNSIVLLVARAAANASEPRNPSHLLDPGAEHAHLLTKRAVQTGGRRGDV